MVDLPAVCRPLVSVHCLFTIRLPDNTCGLKTAFSELNYFNQAYITQSVVLAVAVLLRPL